MKKNCESYDVTLFEQSNIETKSKTIENIQHSISNFYWGPNETVIKMIEQLCLTNNYEKILEIGPGLKPFKLANHFIGSNEKIKNYIEIDIDTEKIPYYNDNLDFVYCRHVLEDIQNPDFVLSEIFRVSKNGAYIETPSPLIETTKNVDCYHYSNMYCGYIHHRYIVWSNIEKNEIYFLPKYSCILDHYLLFNDDIKQYIYNLINNYPVYWNNYFVYNKEKPKVIMYKNGINFNFIPEKSNISEEYIQLVIRAINESIVNTNYFIKNYSSFLNLQTL
jgi:hypothetical protein